MMKYTGLALLAFCKSDVVQTAYSGLTVSSNNFFMPCSLLFVLHICSEMDTCLFEIVKMQRSSDMSARVHYFFGGGQTITPMKIHRHTNMISVQWNVKIETFDDELLCSSPL